VDHVQLFEIRPDRDLQHHHDAGQPAIAHINPRMPCVPQPHELDSGWAAPGGGDCAAEATTAALDFWQIAACVGSSRYNDAQLLTTLQPSTR
jgi:hypothetical protein